MWAIPNIPDHKNSGTDHVTMIHYPHFSSNEVHSDYVDCLQFFGDLIISKSAKERRIIFWRINGFPPTLYPTHNSLPAAPAPERGRASFTRSAFGSGFDRLLTFDLPFADLFYMRFALFHMPEKHPILCAGNEKSKVFFWDFHRLEEGPPAVTESGRWAGHRKKGLLQHNDSEAADDGTNTDLDAADSIEVDESGFKKPSRRKRDEAKPNRPTWIRGESHASNADTVSTDATPSTSFTGATEQGLGRGKGKAKTDPDAKYSADDPFRPLQAHKFQVIPKVAFAVRQCAWSPGGEWCVACGDNGMVALFSRWVGEK